MLLEFVKIGLTLWPTWILFLGLHAMVYRQVHTLYTWYWHFIHLCFFFFFFWLCFRPCWYLTWSQLFAFEFGTSIELGTSRKVDIVFLFFFWLLHVNIISHGHVFSMFLKAIVSVVLKRRSSTIWEHVYVKLYTKNCAISKWCPPSQVQPCV